MFENCVAKITKLEKDGEIIGELTTMVSTSHYGIPEWSGCSCELEIGDKIKIYDGEEPWEAEVMGIDEHDGWVLVLAEPEVGEYLAIHPENGWLNDLEGAEGLDAQEIVAGLNEGTVKLQYGIRLSEGWGCL